MKKYEMCIRDSSRLVQVEPEEELQAAHANFKVRIPMERVKPYSMLRMKKE